MASLTSPNGCSETADSQSLREGVVDSTQRQWGFTLANVDELPCTGGFGRLDDGGAGNSGTPPQLDTPPINCETRLDSSRFNNIGCPLNASGGKCFYCLRGICGLT